jgi:membrane-bound lytic murein transglycosylase D
VHTPPSGNLQKIYYTVKTGDNLGAISEQYKVRVADLKYWNNIFRNMIRVGQKLVIYVPKSRANAVASHAKPAPAASKTSDEFIYYEVKNGDTLWNIASQYEGVTTQDLRKWNNLTTNATIKPGERIKIRRK